MFELDELATQFLLGYSLFLRLGMLLFLELLHLCFIHSRDKFSTSKHRVILLVFFHSESLAVTDLVKMFRDTQFGFGEDLSFDVADFCQLGSHLTFAFGAYASTHLARLRCSRCLDV